MQYGGPWNAPPGLLGYPLCDIPSHYRLTANTRYVPVFRTLHAYGSGHRGAPVGESACALYRIICFFHFFARALPAVDIDGPAQRHSRRTGRRPVIGESSIQGHGPGFFIISVVICIYPGRRLGFTRSRRYRLCFVTADHGGYECI